MPSPIELKKKPSETELQYINRIGQLKTDGLLDMTWQELTHIFNKELREPGVEYTESAYRKKYASIRQFNNEFADTLKDVGADELRELRIELEKEKVKVRDERNEYRKLIRDEARKESYQEQFIRSIEETAGKHPLEYDKSKQKYVDGEASMIIPLYDLHTGIEIKNFWNVYNSDILKDRFNHYLNRIFEIQKRHGCNNAYVCCSEILSGCIHPVLRIQNNQDVIEQFLMVVDYICDFLAELSYTFENVNVYVAPRNHSRINPKKDQNLEHENLDNLLLPFLTAKLQLFNNVHCYENDIEQTMAVFSVYDINVVAIHGDKDPFKHAADLINKFLKMNVGLIITGHKHTNQLTTSADVKCVQSGCLSGPDEFSLNNRMRNRPEQAVCVVTAREGLDCIYDIKF